MGRERCRDEHGTAFLLLISVTVEKEVGQHLFQTQTFITVLCSTLHSHGPHDPNQSHHPAQLQSTGAN